MHLHLPSKGRVNDAELLAVSTGTKIHSYVPVIWLSQYAVLQSETSPAAQSFTHVQKY